MFSKYFSKQFQTIQVLKTILLIKIKKFLLQMKQFVFNMYKHFCIFDDPVSKTATSR